MGEETSMFELLNERMEKEDIEKLVCNYDNKFNELEEENKQLKFQLQQKENIIKELNDKIEDDKMIIEGNWGCIDNLRKDYNLQKNIIKEVREHLQETITRWEDYEQFYEVVVEDKYILEILEKENMK